MAFIVSQLSASSLAASCFFEGFGFEILAANLLRSFSPRYERIGFFSSLNY